MEALITVFDWRRQWLTVICSISSIIWAEDTNWLPGRRGAGVTGKRVSECRGKQQHPAHGAPGQSSP